MALSTSILNGANSFLSNYGNNIRIKYYTLSYSGANYDDPYVSVSGTPIWVNGYLQPLRNPSAAEQKLVDAGNLLINDSKLFLPGSLGTDVDQWTKFGVGSPNMQQYAMIENGKTSHKIASSSMYNLIYVRRLNRGLFNNELTGEQDLDVSGVTPGGNNDIRTAGRFINTSSANGFVQLANDGNYYEERIMVIDGVPTKVFVNLGSSV